MFRKKSILTLACLCAVCVIFGCGGVKEDITGEKVNETDISEKEIINNDNQDMSDSTESLETDQETVEVNEPEIVNSMISFDDACNRIDELTEKYSMYYDDNYDYYDMSEAPEGFRGSDMIAFRYIEANFMSLESDTLQQLEDKYLCYSTFYNEKDWDYSVPEEYFQDEFRIQSGIGELVMYLNPSSYTEYLSEDELKEYIDSYVPLSEKISYEELFENEEVKKQAAVLDRYIKDMCAIDKELCDLESSLKYVRDYDNAEAFIQDNKETIDKINELKGRKIDLYMYLDGFYNGCISADCPEEYRFPFALESEQADSTDLSAINCFILRYIANLPTQKIQVSLDTTKISYEEESESDLAVFVNAYGERYIGNGNKAITEGVIGSNDLFFSQFIPQNNEDLISVELAEFQLDPWYNKYAVEIPTEYKYWPDKISDEYVIEQGSMKGIFTPYQQDFPTRYSHSTN